MFTSDSSSLKNQLDMFDFIVSSASCLIRLTSSCSSRVTTTLLDAVIVSIAFLLRVKTLAQSLTYKGEGLWLF